ncbi:MAG: type II toxin-antitoxin system RelE/ParE family toxin [Defluviitaleaceae bacterium]|nr:type II toxin-antitoxin system RelE/ParE family toxin [Defluviitaleaceae bacterium]
MTKGAKRDLKGIEDYIAQVLLMPETADRQVNKIGRAVKSLEIMPKRYRLCDDISPRFIGVRMLPVGNYLIVYRTLETSNVVEIVRVLYGSSDITRHLGGLAGVAAEDDTEPEDDTEAD